MQVPKALIESLANAPGFNKVTFENIHQSGEQVTSVRINSGKYRFVHKDTAADDSKNLFFESATPVPWCSTGYYLPERPSFTLDPLFHAGAYYVQEASSMFLEQIVKTVFPDYSVMPYRVLDLCAAPGGKSTQLSDLFTEGLVVANEVIKTRSGILAENAVKWGNDNLVVTSNDPKDFQRLQGYFDMVVVDAPCSGSGMFRKDAEAIKEWSLQNVAYCSKRQQRILEDIWPALKEDGILVYSTCSYSTAEDETITDWLGNNFPVENIAVPVRDGWGIVESISPEKKLTCYRFYPDKIKGEGFFVTCVRKKNSEAIAGPNVKKFSLLPNKSKGILNEFIAGSNELDFILKGEETIAVKKKWMEDMSLLFSGMYVKKMGVNIGKILRDELIPSHELALSMLMVSNFNYIELNTEQALQYLRRNNMYVQHPQKGWGVVIYNGYNLGWVKVLANRINNYYPQSFRILKQ
ncbi:MAG: RNA methyltransferase [Chitinophagaceae bacterium]|nr:RNA methyltransferase [Chitinophagaceae bacterium]